MTLRRIVPLALVLLVSGSSASSAAQNVWRVDSSGSVPGAFLKVQQAIDAASNGDTIVVRGGAYVEEIVIDGKGLKIVPEVGQGYWFTVLFPKGCVIRNVPADQEVAVRGLGVLNKSFLILENNAGPVWIEDCTWQNPNAGIMKPGVRVSNCEFVSMRLTHAHGSPGSVPFGSLYFFPANGLEVENSTVCLFDCNFFAGMMGGVPLSFAAKGAVLKSGEIYADYTSFMVQAGSSVPSFVSTQPNSHVEFYNCTFNGAPNVYAGTSILKSGPNLRWSANSPVYEGQTLNFEAVCETPQIVYALISDKSSAQPLFIPGVQGPLILDLAESFGFQLSTPICSGTVTYTIPAPTVVPAMQSLPFTAQLLFVAPDFSAVLVGAGCEIVLLDSGA